MILVGGSSYNNGIEFSSQKYKVKFKNFGNETKIYLLKNEGKETTKISNILYKIPFIRGIVLIYNINKFLAIFLLFSIFLEHLYIENSTITNSPFVKISLYIISFVIAIILMKNFFINIKTTWRYHGAEHKVIITNYQKKEINFENCKKAPRIADNCGTMLVALFIPIIILIHTLNSIFNLKLYSSIIIVMAYIIAYELFLLNRDTPILKIFFKFGYLFQQYVVTSEPTNLQLKRAIEAFNILENAETGKLSDIELNDLLKHGKLLNF